MSYSLNKLYLAIGYSKQGLHQHLDRQLSMHSLYENLYKIVVQIRKDHPTLSCRAMYYKIQPETIGRDKFESLCNQWGLVQDRPVNAIRTTFSSGVIRFENLYKDVQFTDINQAFVSDITYFEVGERFYYITLITDAFSRYIAGYHVSARLLTEETTIPSLLMLLKHKKHQLNEGVIFHSDGGGQYYDKAFLELTKKYKFKNSMCEFAYENGKAERINGILKNNYLKHQNIKSLNQLKQEVDRCVSLYNNDRPHKSLNYKTPKEIEKLSIFVKTNKADDDRVIRCKNI